MSTLSVPTTEHNIQHRDLGMRRYGARGVVGLFDCTAGRAKGSSYTVLGYTMQIVLWLGYKTSTGARIPSH